MKKNKSIIIIVIGAIILVLGVLFLLLFNENKKNDKTENDSNIEEKKEAVTIDETIVNLISNLVSIEKIDLANSFFVYQNKKVTLENLDSKIYYGNALNLIEMSDTRLCTEEEVNNNPKCDIVVDSKVLINKVKELYGNENVDLPQKINGSMYISCTLNKDVYECLNHGPEDEVYNDYTEYFGMTDYVNARVITKAEKSEKYLYIYEKYISLRLDTTNFNAKDLNTYNYSLYKYSNADAKINDDIVLGKDYYEDKSTSFGSKVIEKYANVATNYKHTFKKQADGSYIYVSTEEVK